MIHTVEEKTVTMPDGTKIQVFSRDVESANILKVEAGTTGYMGGDTGHGGRTYFRIKDGASTDIDVKLIKECGETTGFEVFLGGDTELDTMITALKFIIKVLKSQRKISPYYMGKEEDKRNG